MKKQVFVIGGGMTFKSKKDHLKWLKGLDVSLEGYKSWSRDDLPKKLGNKYQVSIPKFPCADNAKYKEWKLVFETYVPLLKNNVTLIGVSLGGIFLAKYLSENKFPRKIKAAYLVSAPYDNSITGEDLVGGFTLKSDLSKLEKQVKNLTLMFSKDDDVVPVAHAEKYRKKLPNANIIIYKSKNGHFKVPTFPELVRMIKKDGKRK